MNVVFYNEHQHGDIILSKQNVRWIIDHSPKNMNFFYLHNRNPKSVFIHEKIKTVKASFDLHSSPTPNLEKLFKNKGYFVESLWVSTWLGSIYNVRPMIDEKGWQKYLFPDQNLNYNLGINKELWDSVDSQLILCKQNIDLINNFITLNFSSFKIPYPNLSEDMLIKWNENRSNTQAVDEILDFNYRIKILICNGDVASNQRINFDYGKYLEKLVDKYNKVLFYFTQNVSLERKNVININNYLKLPNLNEIEYLSKFCSIIVTSLSGPGCAVINDAVVKDQSKTLIYVCRKCIGIVYEKSLCKILQTEDFSYESINEIIENAILEKILK
jgi:hypothetical protein